LNHALKSEVVIDQKKEANDNPIRVVKILFLLLLLLLLRLFSSSVVVVASFFARLLFVLPSFACLFLSFERVVVDLVTPATASRVALCWPCDGDPAVKSVSCPEPTALPLFTLFPSSQCVLFLRVEEKTFW
jgi:hypothetical protein